MAVLDVAAVPHDRLTDQHRDAIVALCSLAYDEPFEAEFRQIALTMHLIGRLDGRIVSHAATVTRWLQPERLTPLRTAYVEAVATHPDYEGNGYASRLLRALPALHAGHDLMGLSPSDAGFYARLGWESWQGPLLVRTDTGLEPSPGEELMILRLAGTPPMLDPRAPISIEWRPGDVW